MPQFQLIDVSMGVDIFMDEVEAVVMVTIFLRIKVIIINLTIRKNNSNNQKLNHSQLLSGKAIGPHNKRVYEIECYICGMKGNRSRTCHTAKHLVELYQASIKGKGNQIETNFINGQGTMDLDDPYQVSLQEANNQIDDNFINNDGAIPLTHFDISDFFEDLSGKIDHLIGDGNMCYD